MKIKLMVIAIALFTFIQTGAAVLAQQSGPAAARQSAAQGRHCVEQVHQIPEGSDPAQLPDEAPATATCFRTFAQALQAATGATSGIDPNITPADVTDELLASLAATSAAASPNAPAAPASTIIGVGYSSANYTGYTLITSVGNSVGCATGYSYYNSSPPRGWWNDQISSYRGYNGCAAVYLFEHASYQGAVLRCNWCSSLAALDNRTSSRQWHRTSGHY